MTKSTQVKTPVTDKHTWKEKEISKEEMCVVEFSEQSGDWGSDGGHRSTYFKVTDKTSKEAYSTLREMLIDLSIQAPENSEQPEDIPVNKRANRAVDIV